MEVTPAFYAHLLTPLMALAEGKVAVALEVICHLTFLSILFCFLELNLMI